MNILKNNINENHGLERLGNFLGCREPSYSPIIHIIYKWKIVLYLTPSLPSKSQNQEEIINYINYDSKRL